MFRIFVLIVLFVWFYPLLVTQLDMLGNWNASPVFCLNSVFLICGVFIVWLCESCHICYLWGRAWCTHYMTHPGRNGWYISLFSMYSSSASLSLSLSLLVSYRSPLTSMSPWQHTHVCGQCRDCFYNNHSSCFSRARPWKNRGGVGNTSYLHFTAYLHLEIYHSKTPQLL